MSKIGARVVNGHIRQLKQRYGSISSSILEWLLPYCQDKSARYACLLGQSVTLFGVATLSYAAYLRSQTASSDIFHNVVSSLGWGGNGSHETFKFGLSLVAVLCLYFVLCSISRLRANAHPHNFDEISSSTQTAALHWLNAAWGLLILAWFVDIRQSNNLEFMVIFVLHCFGAGLFFVSSMLAVNHTNRAMAISGMPNKLAELLGQCMFYSGLVMVISIIPLLFFAYAEFNADPSFTQVSLFMLTPEQRIDWLQNSIAAFPLPAISEWVMGSSLLLWVSIFSIQMLFQASIAHKD